MRHAAGMSATSPHVRALIAALVAAALLAPPAQGVGLVDGARTATTGQAPLVPATATDLGAGYLLPLAGDPLAVTSAASRAGTPVENLTDRALALATRRAAIVAEQQEAIARIRALAPSARVARRYAVAWNGLHVRVPPDDAGRLRSAGFDLLPNSPVEALLNQSVPQVRADRAWGAPGPDADPLDGGGMTIAILDTGVDYTHPDLGGCLGPGCKVEGGRDLVNGGADPMDDHGHGTHVASIAAGDGTFRGVAPGATILAYKVMDADAKGHVADVIAGLEAAVDPDGDGDTADAVDVVNISLGCVDWGVCTPDDPLSQAVDNVVADGVVVVAAAGNAGWVGVASPASARRAIAVGASSGVSGTASFSSEGPVSWDDRLLGKPDLVAPGVGVCAARRPGFAPGSICHWAARHVRLSGSSMAAAHVSGAAAILRQARPDLTPREVTAVLRATASPLPEFNNSGSAMGAGVLDVKGAVDAAGAPGTHVPTVDLEPLSAVDWPRAVRASVAASDVSRWRLEVGGLHQPTWSVIAEGTELPSDGVFHVFETPLYSEAGPRLRLVVETVSGARAVDQSWMPSHKEYATPVLGAGVTGLQHNGWSHGTRALYSDDLHAEALDDPAKAHITFSFSNDGGSTWRPVPEALVLPDGADRWVEAATAVTEAGTAFTPERFRLRMESANGSLLQDFGGFDLRVPAEAAVTSLRVRVEGHNRWTHDPVLGQPLTVTRRIDEVAIRVRYKLTDVASAAPSSVAFTDVDSAPSCLVGCHSEPHVAIRSDQRPVVAYRDIARDSLALLVCGDADCGAGSVHTQVDGAPGCALGCGPERGWFGSVSVALRNDNRPVIAYVAESGDPAAAASRDLWVVSCGDQVCRTGNVYRKFDMAQFEPAPPSNCVFFICEPGSSTAVHSYVGTATLALSPAGAPVITLAARVPQEEHTVVRVLTCDTADCTGPVTGATLEGAGCSGVCDPKSEVVWPIALTFRPDGRPVVTYQQQYVWTGAQKTSVDRVKMVTCGNRTCTTANTTTMVTPHTGHSALVRLQSTGLPTVAFLAGSVPQPLVVTCRTAVCAGPPGRDLLEQALPLEGWGACTPGCNTRASHGFRQSMVLRPNGAPVIAVHDQHAGSLKLIRCSDEQCAHHTTYQQIDGATGCPVGCSPTSLTGKYPSLARRSPDGALVVAYRDLTREVLRLAVVRF